MTCAFFGHRRFDYSKWENKIFQCIWDLVENKNVTQFYSTYSSQFDRLCANYIFEIRKSFPDIVNTMALCYYPSKNFELPSCFNDSLYTIDRFVPPKFAIHYTNKKIVDISDLILSGVKYTTGGAATACKYAMRKNKTIIDIFNL